MRYIIAAYLTAVAIVIIAKMITHAKSGRVELFSIRNMFLTGFSLFQLSSAVLCLSHKVIMLEAMNDPDQGVSVNVGTIKGGIGANTVAEEASAGVDIRYLQPPQRGEILSKVDSVVKASKVPGGSGTMEITSERPPMPVTERNRELFNLLRAQARRIGIPVKEELRSGVSDANIIAERGIPVLDGLGPIGGRDHSDKEYMVKKSLLPRTQLFALTLIAAWEHYSSKEDSD